MIRFGIIGTSWITEEFIRCAKRYPDFVISAVYSRSPQKASEFAEKVGAAHTFNDLTAMAESDLIDAVYIASPNSLHAEQSILFMEHKKHVLCEKSASANVKELMAMIEAAKRNQVAFMEAMISTLQPGMQAMKKNLAKLGKIRRYFGSYCQYSSRYDAYKAGVYNNTFNPDFANGALMDLGVYCIYPLVYLFGKPEAILASAVKLPSGVDGETALICQYKDMDAVIMCSKITASAADCEIQGETGTMAFSTVNQISKVEIRYNDRQKSAESVDFAPTDAYMYFEAKEFMEMIKEKRIESAENSFQLALDVRAVMDEVRRQIGLSFPNDAK